MKAAVYVVKQRSSWNIVISIDPRVDALWWEGRLHGGGRREAPVLDRAIVLGHSLPLGWAVKLRTSFRYRMEMEQWDEAAWSGYAKHILERELVEEKNSLRTGVGKHVGMRDLEASPVLSDVQDLPSLPKLLEAADWLALALPGRSLLESEMEALLTERRPELLDHWRSAAQLAYLQGRLQLEAAVGVPERLTGSQEKRKGARRAEFRQANSCRSTEGTANPQAESEEERGTRSGSRPQRGRKELQRERSTKPLGTSPREKFIDSETARERDEWTGMARKRSDWSRSLGVGSLTGRGVRWAERSVQWAGRSVRWAERGVQWAERGIQWVERSVQRLGRAARLSARHIRPARRSAAALPRCLRCGSAATGRTACAACGLAGCAYCEACLALGRSRACALLLRGAALPAVRSTAAPAPAELARRWGLSAAQADAASAALRVVAEPRTGSASGRPERFLLWAVTGAGKTEMIFPLLESVLAAGGRALVATPRRDVVLELAPRLAKAFPAESIAVLYGGSQDRWKEGRLALATTHQLLRFHHGFDLVIIDELDAFPYHNDPMLAFAAEGACKRGGTFIYLSATPPAAMQREVRRGTLAHARVPVRFHGFPLPLPKHLKMSSVEECLKRGRLPVKLIRTLRQSLGRQAQIFLFVARIAQIDRLLWLLRRVLPGISIEGTSSRDPERAEKVAAFRRREISLLVTTTILERGVTVPRSDVFVLDADNRLFDEASLVQIAGRAGRSKDDPNGGVVFASSQWNRSQRGACAQIRTMNRIARAKGYFRKEGL